MIHENLRELLKCHNMTGAEFAKKMGVTAAKASRWLTGITEPGIADVLKICSIFKVPVDYIILGKYGNRVLSDSDLKFLSFTEVQKKRLLALKALIFEGDSPFH